MMQKGELVKKLEQDLQSAHQKIADLDEGLEFYRNAFFSSEMDRRRDAMRLIEAHQKIAEAQWIVSEQAEDDGIWFVAETITENYLQRCIRRLHAAIEGETAEECARDFLRED